MPRGYYDRKKSKKNATASTGKTTHVNELTTDTTNLVLQNGDREMVKGLLEKKLEKANKRVAKLKNLLEQIPA